MKKLISLICDKMICDQPTVRKLILSWLYLLFSIPNVNLINRASQLLPLLISYLAENDDDIKIKAQKQLDDLLTEFQNLETLRETQMDEDILNTLTKYYNYNEFRDSILCRSVTVSWTEKFLNFFISDLNHSKPASMGILDY